MNAPERTHARPELTRVLGLWDCISVIVGIIIGSGIFFAPTAVANELNSIPWILFVWLVGGVAALCGALSYAALSVRWPHTGGMYVFLREAFGPLASFIFGWAELLVIRPAGAAAIAVIFAQYVGYFVQLSQNGVKLVSVLAIVSVSLINYVGVRFTSIVQNTLTALKVGALALFILSIFWHAPALHLSSVASPFETADPISVLSALGVALVSVFWTYDGWNEITLVAGEVKNPERTLPKALIWSSILIMALYLLVNAALFQVMSVQEIRSSEHVITDAITKVFGSAGAVLVTGVVLISTFGSLNGSALTGPRLYFAMAVDGLFFSWAKRIHPIYKTPSTAILLQALMAIPLVLAWKFDELATYFIFVSLLFYNWVTIVVFKVRVPLWGYPVTPIVFLLVSTGILVNTLVRSPVQALVGVLAVLLGVPFYQIWKKRA
jgi:basic amino acid/polyamine antiporter, APA family